MKEESSLIISCFSVFYISTASTTLLNPNTFVLLNYHIMYQVY